MRMVMVHPYNRGAMRPADLAMLERVFDEACRLHPLDRGSEAARELALRILALFNAGMIDEATLRSAVVFPVQPTSR